MVQVNAAEPGPLVAHFSAIHEATGLPVVVQDYPAVSGVRVAADVLVEVVASCAGFVAAVKAESAPTPPAIAALTAAVDAPVFGGLGGVGLVDELACGAAGAMTGMSHPEGLRATLDAHAAGGFEAAHAAWAPWLPLANFEGQLQDRTCHPQGDPAPSRGAHHRAGATSGGHRAARALARCSTSTSPTCPALTRSSHGSRTDRQGRPRPRIDRPASAAPRPRLSPRKVPTSSSWVVGRSSSTS